ncbi:hypothetical protein N431DRAFT_477107 [Stipitochalara longipes BDJ]|nr:hypothetical protein N431DRAFT_477107 [Stipitochalara longipes BDJ]
MLAESSEGILQLMYLILNHFPVLENVTVFVGMDGFAYRWTLDVEAQVEFRKEKKKLTFLKSFEIETIGSMVTGKTFRWQWLGKDGVDISKGVNALFGVCLFCFLLAPIASLSADLFFAFMEKLTSNTLSKPSSHTERDDGSSKEDPPPGIKPRSKRKRPSKGKGKSKGNSSVQGKEPSLSNPPSGNQSARGTRLSKPNIATAPAPPSAGKALKNYLAKFVPKALEQYYKSHQVGLLLNEEYIGKEVIDKLGSEAFQPLKDITFGPCIIECFIFPKPVVLKSWNTSHPHNGVADRAAQRYIFRTLESSGPKSRLARSAKGLENITIFVKENDRLEIAFMKSFLITSATFVKLRKICFCFSATRSDKERLDPYTFESFIKFALGPFVQFKQHPWSSTSYSCQHEVSGFRWENQDGRKIEFDFVIYR